MEGQKSKLAVKFGNKGVFIAVIFVFFVSLSAVIVYSLFSRYALYSLNQKAADELNQGNYAAALVLYDKLRDVSSDDAEVQSNIAKTKKMLVAEENFLKAQEAVKGDQWLEAEALLKNSEAISNPQFKFYNEALELYNQARGLVDSFEKEISEKITDLRKTLSEEELKRKQAEQGKSQVESRLQNAVSEKEQTEKELKSTQQQLEESQDKVAETQSKFESEQKRAEEMTLEAERERVAKFLNEIKVYVNMLKRGDDYLNLALEEIDKSKDVSALIYISQSKVLFDEAREKSSDLRANRTPSDYIDRVDEVIRTANLFADSLLSFRNAIIYIESKQNDDFSNHFNRGVDLKNQAEALMGGLIQFLNANS